MAEGPTAIEQTPTYSIAIGAAMTIFICLVMKHRFKKQLKRIRPRPVRKVVAHIINELLLMGFASWLLEVFEKPISSVCVPIEVSHKMLPCRAHRRSHEIMNESGKNMLQVLKRSQSCESKGKASLIPWETLDHLHVFIFVLATMHLFCSLLSVGLGLITVQGWHLWEVETESPQYDGQKDLEKRYCEKLKAETKDGRHSRRDACARSPITIWIGCFFRQFSLPVSKDDYLTVRVGFVHNHDLGDPFRFRDYIIESVGKEFKQVIQISWWFWAYVILILLLTVNGWYAYLWAAFIPAILMLILGTQQQYVLATLALRAKKHTLDALKADSYIYLDPEEPVKRDSIISAIKPSDKLFWFHRPRLLLILLRFIMFQNSFELATILWFRITFGWHSCMIGKHAFFYVRIALGIFTLLVSSYSIMPTFALVTKMAASIRTPVPTQDTVYNALLEWRERALVAEGQLRHQFRKPRYYRVSESGTATPDAEERPKIAPPSLSDSPLDHYREEHRRARNQIHPWQGDDDHDIATIWADVSLAPHCLTTTNSRHSPPYPQSP